MERGRRRLEQELNDPFLRDSLERKAAKLPEDQRRDLIARLEARVLDWDSKEAATKILRRYTRYFRLTVLFTIAVITVLYLLLHLIGCSSLPKYLEIVAMSTAMLTASYWAKIGDSLKEEKRQSSPSEIMMGGASASASASLDPSSTQALLASSADEANFEPHGQQ